MLEKFDRQYEVLVRKYFFSMVIPELYTREMFGMSQVSAA